jgi:uracil-DNA glycosylase family 4
MPPRSLAAVSRAVIGCERCARLRRYCQSVAREKVARFREETYWGRPVPGFGDPDARLLIVGLAPAAHGANRTGRMFTGDSSGDWLYQALHRFGFANQPHSVSRSDGLILTDCYIAASARCAPPDNKPLPIELDRCRPYLVAELALLGRVRLIVTLGAIAHRSFLRASGWWDRLQPAERPPFGHGRLTPLPDGKLVLASYHPSRQNTNTGKLTRAMWHGIFDQARRALDSR